MEGKNKWRGMRRYLPLIVLTLLGLCGGYLYYRLVGCATGTCPISSNPYSSTIYGGVIGFLLGVVVSPKKIKEGEEHPDA